MASATSQRIIPLEEGWNDEIKAKASQKVLDEFRQMLFFEGIFSFTRVRTFSMMYIRCELNCGSKNGFFHVKSVNKLPRLLSSHINFSPFVTGN